MSHAWPSLQPNRATHGWPLSARGMHVVSIAPSAIPQTTSSPPQLHAPPHDSRGLASAGGSPPLPAQQASSPHIDRSHALPARHSPSTKQGDPSFTVPVKTGLKVLSREF